MQQLGISPAVIPPFFTNPDILLNRGRGGNIVETPRLRKLAASSRGDKDSHDELSSMAFSIFPQFLNNQPSCTMPLPSDLQDITSTAFASIAGWLGHGAGGGAQLLWDHLVRGGFSTHAQLQQPLQQPLRTPKIPQDSRLAHCTHCLCANTAQEQF